jgi:hypothetical protein
VEPAKPTHQLLYLLLFVLTTVILIGEASSLASGDVKTSYVFASPSFSLHEPVILKFRIHNDSGQPVRVDLGRNYVENLLVTITLPDGMTIVVPPIRRDGAARIGRFDLANGREFAQDLILNEWTDFKTAGVYGIEIHLAKPVQDADGITIQSGSQPDAYVGAVEITPENPVRLASVRRLFAEKAEKSSSFEEAQDAALPLSYVDDPIAVPYLQRVLVAKRGVGLTALNGLERVGDSSAVNVLISALTMTDDPSIPVMARAALERISGATADPAERETIRQALERKEVPE